MTIDIQPLVQEAQINWTLICAGTAALFFGGIRLLLAIFNGGDHKQHLDGATGGNSGFTHSKTTPFFLGGKVDESFTNPCTPKK